MADKAIDPGLESVMLLLTEEEAKHCEHYRSLAEGAETALDDNRRVSAVTEGFLTMREKMDAY